MQVMNLEDCDVYSYVPDAEADPFANVGSMWVLSYPHIQPNEGENIQSEELLYLLHRLKIQKNPRGGGSMTCN
jgi:hypothetical protein